MKRTFHRGYGTSMLPLIRPGEEVWSEAVDPSEIRTGDLITFWPEGRGAASLKLLSREVPQRGASASRSRQPGSREDASDGSGIDRLMTHRVVQCLRIGERLAFLTKGDNRAMFDPLVLPDRVIGRVIRVGNRDLTRPGWRGLGKALAGLSYAQALFTHRLLCLRFSRWNRIRCALARRGWIPKLALARPYRAFIVWLAGGWIRGWESAGEAGVRLRCTLSGVRVRRGGPEDLAEVAACWNRDFPAHRTSAQRLSLLVGPDLQSAASALWVASHRGRIAAWALARQRGIVEGFGCVEESTGFIGELLLRRVVAELRRRGAKEILLGPFPAKESDLAPMDGVAVRCGFIPRSELVAMAVEPARFRPQRGVSLPDGLEIRPWQDADGGRFRSDFPAREYRPERVDEHLRLGGRKDRIWVAALGGKPAGIVQGIPDPELISYRQLGPAGWVLPERALPTGYLFHCVVHPAHRGRGVGDALIERCLQDLFAAGCRQVVGWTRQPRYFRRFGFVGRERWITMARDEGRR